ncbi:ATP-binding protein [Desulfovibrio mangrovi]|uniref:ATP-binding protein n=1 Tax=Desulfovibrio mangrovi TaxID=2976983 RepID=UPI002245075E|nr:ATP-binding protein [Desulfovibrio mangrovi]UZP68800.1 ATP-binding protein [Desulfovibrio mangrovi]
MDECKDPFSTSFVQAVFERLPVGIMVIDPAGVIIAINQALCSMIGLSQNHARGKVWVDVFDIGHRNLAFHQLLTDVIHGELPSLNRYVSFEREDGAFVDLGILSSFIKHNDMMLGIAVIMQDMTAINSKHEDERDALERIASIVNEREVALLNLAEAVAHQVRNPVTVIGGQVNLLMREQMTLTKPERLNVIREESIKLEGIVKELNGFVSIHARQPDWVSILEVFASWLDAFCKNNPQYVCTINDMTCEPPDADQDSDLLWADPFLLRLILSELVANTLDFASHNLHPIATISTHKNAKTLRVTYEDNSCGIAEHILPYIFDPFFTTKSSGVGMGLCKVRRAMMVMGGTARVWPSVCPTKGGVCVHLDFPVSQPPNPRMKPA